MRLTVGAIDHYSLLLALLLQRLLGKLDTLRIVVRALGTTPQNDKAMLVAARSGDRSQALLCDAHENGALKQRIR